MSCCAIIQDMIVKDRRSLDNDIEEFAGNVHVYAEFKFCFELDGSALFLNCVQLLALVPPLATFCCNLQTRISTCTLGVWS